MVNPKRVQAAKRQLAQKMQVMPQTRLLQAKLQNLAVSQPQALPQNQPKAQPNHVPKLQKVAERTLQAKQTHKDLILGLSCFHSKTVQKALFFCIPKKLLDIFQKILKKFYFFLDKPF